MHLDDETLRGYLDRQLVDMTSAADHLNTCADCRVRLEEVQARSARVSTHLASLDPAPSEAPQVQTAFAQLQAKQRFISPKERHSMLNSIFSQRLRPLWIGACIVALFTVAFTLPPVRAWAGDLLSRFRVQRIAVLPVDNTRLSELGMNSTFGKQISQLLSDSATITKKADKARVVSSAAQASQVAGFQVRLPSSRKDTPQLSVHGGTAFQIVVNRTRAQKLINEAGFDRFKLPASVDGAVIKVDIPNGVAAAYGECPKPEELEGDESVAGAMNSASSPKGSTGRRMINCTMLVQMPSPTVDAPSDLDIQQLAQMGLEFSGMTPDQARSFSATVDWTSTLVIPIPRNGASYKQVPVDGVTGYMIQRPTDDAPQYALVWVKNGIVYAIGGLGGDTTGALEMANSLK